MLEFDNKQRNFVDLKALIQKDPSEVVPFVGAGLSVYGPPEERLPLWKGLIDITLSQGYADGVIDQKIIKKVQSSWDKGKTIKAIDLVIEYIGLPKFRQLIESSLDISEREIPPAITELVAVAWSLMVTTNLDQFIERAWNEINSTKIEVVTQKERTRLARLISGAEKTKKCVLAKIHGTIERFETWVLDERHYNILVERDQAYVNTLRSLFLKNIFFIGYGLRDRDFDILLDQIRTIYPEGIGTYFALIDSRYRGTQHINNLIRWHGLRPIWYEVNPKNINEHDCGHGQVISCLKLLKDRDLLISNFKVNLQRFPDQDSIFVGRKNELKEIFNKISSPNAPGLQIVGFGGEGKTSLVLQFLYSYKNELINAGFGRVYGCCFYHLDETVFINEFYNYLSGDETSADNTKKVSYICSEIEKRRILIVFDGFEVFQSSGGNIDNRNIKAIYDSTIKGKSTVLITTRMSLSGGLPKLVLKPLGHLDVKEIYHLWGVKTSNGEIEDFTAKHIGNHALSIRLFAGLLKSYPGDFQNAMYFNYSILQRGELSTLSSNIAARILDRYQTLLEHFESQTLSVISLFTKPIPIGSVLNCAFECLSSNELSIGQIQNAIKKLLDLRLIMQEAKGDLTMHPSIREFYRAKIDSSTSKSWHGLISNYFVDLVEGLYPDNMDQLSDFFSICYHASKAEEWTLFHDTFYRVINRKHKNFLGNNLGSWEDFYSLAKMTLISNKNEPVIHPEYYLSCIARASKHMGKTEEALRYYLKCVLLCVKNKHFEADRFSNNFMSLAITSGHLEIAQLLSKINIASLQWDSISWHRCWQEEYALYSIGYLLGLKGNVSTAILYCEHGNKTWDRYKLKKEYFFDYYKVYHCELLLVDSFENLAEAEQIATSNLEVAQANRWHESEALAFRALSFCERAKLADNTKSLFLARAERHLASANEAIKNMSIPRTEIELILEQIRIVVWDWLYCKNNEIDLDNFIVLLDKVKGIIDVCGFKIYLSEFEAAMGWYYLFLDKKKQAEYLLKSALDSAKIIGDRLTVSNKLKLISPLALQLGVKSKNALEPPKNNLKPIELLKTEVSSKELFEILVNVQLQLS